MTQHAQAAANASQGAGDSLSLVRRTDWLLPLAREAASGAPGAARALIVQVGPAIIRTVRKILGPTHADVDDVTQDAMIALLDALDGFRGEATVLGFAIRIAEFTAIAARRKQANRVKYASVAMLEHCRKVDDRSPQALLATKQRRETVLRLLENLPETMAEALTFHFVLGMTVEEIAAATNAPTQTVWSRLRLGKRALRRRISGNGHTATVLRDAM